MILVYDCAISGFSVGLFNTQHKLLHEVNHTAAFGYTEHLVPYIKDLLSRSALDFSDLTKIVTTNGPGSFTGIRAGLAVATGLRIALGIEVITTSTLSAIAYTWLENKQPSVATELDILVDTKCGDFYYQPFNVKGINVDETNHINIATPDDVNNMTGTLISPSKTALASNCDIVTPSLKGILVSAQQKPQHTLEPLYVRGAHVNVK